MNFLTIFLIICLYSTISPTLCQENKHSPEKQQEVKCDKDASGQEHCNKPPVKDDDDEPSFYEDEDIEEDPSLKWTGRERLFQWDPIKVSVCILSTPIRKVNPKPKI